MVRNCHPTLDRNFAEAPTQMMICRGGSSIGDRDGVATNSPPRDIAIEAKADKIHSQTLLKQGSMSRNSSGSFSSSLASVFDRSMKTKDKSSPESMVNLALFTLVDDDDVPPASPQSADRRAAWRGKAFSTEAIKSPALMFGPLMVPPHRSSDPSLPQSIAPVIPHILSEPCLPQLLDLKNDTGRDQTDLQLRDLNPMRFCSEAPQTPTDQIWKEQSRRRFRFEGTMLECPELSDDGIESDLTRTDQEEEDSSLEGIQEYPQITISPKKSPRKSPSSRRRHGKPNDKDLQALTIPSSPSELPRDSTSTGRGSHGLPRHSASTGRSSSEVDHSDSFTRERMSIGTGGTLKNVRGRGRSRGLLRTPDRKGERRWSPRAGVRDGSSDEILRTPMRSSAREDLFPNRGHSDHIPTKPRNRRSSIDEVTSPQYQTPVMVPRKQYEVPSEHFFCSPPPEGRLNYPDSDNRAPSTTRPTPSPEGGAHHLREKIQSLKCPPPL